MQLGTLITRHARYRPDRTAVIHEDARLTFRDFDARVNRLANALLRIGVRKGDKIACVLQNCLELLDLYWAVAKIGAVVVPLSPLLAGRGLSALIAHSDSVMVLTGPTNAADLDAIRDELTRVPSDRYVIVGGARKGYLSYDELVREAPVTEPPPVAIGDEDPLMIIYSSGTTGDPKGIVLTHYARAMYCTLYASAWRMTPESVSLHAGSLVFNGAFMTLFPSFFLGGTYILHRQFDPHELIATIEREKVTHIVMVPSQILALLDCPALTPQRLASIEGLISLGATLHLQHKERLQELLPGRFYEMYGLAEGFMTILDSTDPLEKLGSVGTPPPFFEMRIVDALRADLPPGQVGEIVGRGPIMMQGYYGRRDLTDQAVVDGWLYSGDLGYADDDGYLFLADRKKDLIKSGGVSVYPRDIEEIIAQNPAVGDAAVFGVPHGKWGETPVAAVVLSSAGKISEGALKAWINASVSARFQRVSDVVILNEFPRNAAGKTLKRTLRDDYLREKRMAD